ncbi:MAG: EF-hand domain-containing protein, partial [Verrucomicrobiota bacterium]
EKGQGGKRGQGADGARLFEADADGDGLVTREELENHRAKRMMENNPRHLQRFDADGDGQLSLEEVQTMNKAVSERRGDNKDRMEQMFERLDANGDGAISREELESVRENAQRGNSQRGQGGGNGQGRGKK